MKFVTIKLNGLIYDEAVYMTVKSLMIKHNFTPLNDYLMEEYQLCKNNYGDSFYHHLPVKDLLEKLKDDTEYRITYCGTCSRA